MTVGTTTTEIVYSGCDGFKPATLCLPYAQVADSGLFPRPCADLPHRCLLIGEKLRPIRTDIRFRT